MIDVRAVTDLRLAKGDVEAVACQRLRAFAAETPAGQAVVEIGSWLGRTAGWLALGATEGHGARVTCVDTWELRARDTYPSDYGYTATIDSYAKPETRRAFEAHIAACGLTDQIDVRQGFATDVAKDWTRPVGLLFHYGPHDYELVLDDLLAWTPHIAAGGVLALHDAGNAEYGVYQAARTLLRTDPAWDWDGRELQRNPAKPWTRGILVVRKLA